MLTKTRTAASNVKFAAEVYGESLKYAVVEPRVAQANKKIQKINKFARRHPHAVAVAVTAVATVAPYVALGVYVNRDQKTNQ